MKPSALLVLTTLVAGIYSAPIIDEQPKVADTDLWYYPLTWGLKAGGTPEPTDVDIMYRQTVQGRAAGKNPEEERLSVADVDEEYRPRIAGWFSDEVQEATEAGIRSNVEEAPKLAVGKLYRTSTAERGTTPADVDAYYYPTPTGWETIRRL